MGKSSKGLLASMVALAVVSPSAVAQTGNLNDISGHWAEKAIVQAASGGYVNGYEDGSFKPDGTISRAEFIKLVASMLDSSIQSESGVFWYMPYVRSLQKNGVLSDSFYADDMAYPIARGEMAMIAVKAIDSSLSGSMYEAVAKGLIQGSGSGQVDINENSTRAQATVVLDRIAKVRAGEKLPVDMNALTVLETTKHVPIKRLKDISGHWAEAAINQAVERGYVDGYEDGTFKPDASVSYAEFIKLLVAAMDIGAAQTGTNWYDTYVEAAKAAGIYKDDFKPEDMNKAIPREEMAILAVRSSGYKTTWPYEKIERKQWLWEATRAGLILGTTPGEVSPKGLTTRAQSITVLNRVLDIKAGKELPTDKYAMGAAEIYWHKTNILSVLPQYFMEGHLNDKPFEYQNLKYIGKNGSHEVLMYMAIDMDDPNDPWAKYLPKNASWRFRDENDKIIYKKEKPTNVYALITVARLQVTLDKDTPSFDAATVALGFGLKEPTGKKIKEGKPYENHRYAYFNEKYWTYQYGIVHDLKKGYNDITFSYGNIIPKGQLIRDDGLDRRIQISYSPAVGLGELGEGFALMWSKVDYSYAK